MMEAEKSTREWVANYHGSCDLTALRMAHRAGFESGQTSRDAEVGRLREALEEIATHQKHSLSCGDIGAVFNQKEMLWGCNCGVNALHHVRTAREALKGGG